MRKLEGIIAPTTTAFDASGKIDLNSCAEQFQWLKEAGCHGLAVGGSTGEGHTLDREEFVKLVDVIPISPAFSFIISAKFCSDPAIPSARATHASLPEAIIIPLRRFSTET